MAYTWFGEVPSCCSLTLLLGPAWVLLKYVLQTIFSGPVEGDIYIAISGFFLGSQPPPRKGHLWQCLYHALEALTSLKSAISEEVTYDEVG